MTENQTESQQQPAPRADGDDHAKVGFRPLLVTFGSIIEPDGGLQVRSRILAESLTSLGTPPTILSTREAKGFDATPPWARSIHVPSHRPWRGFSKEWARLIGRHARDADVVIVANAMFMPALEVSGTRVPMIWDTNECQTLHYERLERTSSNRAKQLIWWGLERWAAATMRLPRSPSVMPKPLEWRRIHPPLRNKLMTVDHAAFVPSVKSEGDPAVLSDRVGGSLRRPVLLFVGTMTAKHNAAAARWLIDVLAPSLADTATIVICGPGSDRLVGSGKAGRQSCCSARWTTSIRSSRPPICASLRWRRAPESRQRFCTIWRMVEELLERPSRSKGSTEHRGWSRRRSTSCQSWLPV